MKTLYFDCFAGASGDMILGALVDAGVRQTALQEQLSLLGVTGYEVTFEKVDRSGINATYARVETAHETSHRHLKDILQIIGQSELSEVVKSRAAQIFTRLASAEGKVHNQPIERVHFHEVGALDAIIDVVGAAICFELLGVERFLCSSLHVGSGTVEMDHGRFPIPPPAVAELLAGAPIYATEIAGELVTPTGAAIITTVCESFGPLPSMRLQSTGYGAGTRSYEKFPNALRVLIGQTGEDSSDEVLWMLETNIDDMPAQYLGHVMEQAFAGNALDCYFTPIQMKKNRPGVMVSILCRSAHRETLSKLLFDETTTLGIRSYEIHRRALSREVVQVQTVYGPIDVKVARLGGRIVKEMPEFEQCRLAALKAGVPLRVVEDAVRVAWAQSNG
jgi:uncharacterized protein (TIGR00299 family) protein